MAKCKTCGEEFHYCSSCGYEAIPSHGYCSEKCINEADKVKEARLLFDFLVEAVGTERASDMAYWADILEW